MSSGTCTVSWYASTSATSGSSCSMTSGFEQHSGAAGIGRGLMQTMFEWMDANSIGEVWVLSDGPGAEEFYAACGFTRQEGQPIYMTHERG